ncbi:MAG: glycosyltransferase family 2 protein [Bdellovibrionales bacterium]|nr:glycosyltransferase family 2 protein [Bdellovibrionales bacterium]
MIRILIPMAGKSKFFSEEGSQFPKPLIEVKGQPIIQHTVECLSKVREAHQFIFVVNKDDVEKYHIHNTLKLLTSEQSVIVSQNGNTKGAACTCLLAVEHINGEEELIISNSDQKIDADLNTLISNFRKLNADAGVVYFESVHPQWSYVKLEGDHAVTEAAEKNPISKNAIAGFYYFKKGKYFVDSAKASISKDAQVNGLYFIAPTLNEMILKAQKVVALKIPNSEYHSFYSWDKIKEFEKK